MPRAPLSVIIPTLNTAASVQATAACLFPAVQDGLIRDLIISDGGSCDGIARIADDIGAKFIAGEPGRGTQLRTGALAAEGEWFLFLHADTRLEDDWHTTVRRHMETSQDAGYFRLKFAASSFAAIWVAGWANRRSNWFDLPYGDQGLLISRPLYTQIGGFPDIPIMEDVAIARQLKGRLRMLDCEAVTDPVRYQDDGWIRRGFDNLTLMASYLAGTPPELIAARYRRRKQKPK